MTAIGATSPFPRAVTKVGSPHLCGLRRRRCARGAIRSGPSFPAAGSFSVMSTTFFRPTRHHPRLRRSAGQGVRRLRVVSVDRQAAAAVAAMGEGTSPLRLILGAPTRVSGLPGGFLDFVEAVEDCPAAIGHHIRRAAVWVVALDLTQFPPMLGALLAMTVTRTVSIRSTVAARTRTSALSAARSSRIDRGFAEGADIRSAGACRLDRADTLAAVRFGRDPGIKGVDPLSCVRSPGGHLFLPVRDHGECSRHRMWSVKGGRKRLERSPLTS